MAKNDCIFLAQNSSSCHGCCLAVACQLAYSWLHYSNIDDIQSNNTCILYAYMCIYNYTAWYTSTFNVTTMGWHSCSARTLNLPPGHDKVQTLPLASVLCSRLGGLLSRPLETRGACAVCSRMCINGCGHPHLGTRHYSSDQSWAFWTCSWAHLLCLPGKDTDYMYVRKLSLWKIFVVVYSPVQV